MSSITEKMESFYSLDLLSPLEPRDNRDMAEIIVGTYIVNARAARQTEDLISQIALSPSQCAAIRLLETVNAVENLDQITRLIGNRALEAIDISPNKEPIRYKGFHTVEEAAGVLGKNAYHKPMIFVPGHPDQLQIASPPRLFRRSDEWFSVQVADMSGDFSPLIELTVANSVRNFR